LASVLKTGLYTLSTRLGKTLITLLTLAIIGRYISVEDFGLFAIVLIFSNLLSPLVDFALTPAYIKLENADKSASSTFFSINVYISILSVILMVLFSWGGAYLFKSENLQSLIAVFSLAIFFSSISGQPSAILKRNKEYDVISKIEIMVSVSGAALVCIMAVNGYGIWALITRGIYEAFINAALLIKKSSIDLRIVGYREIAKYKDSIKFASQIVLSRLPNRALLTIDNVIIGKFMGTEALGFYSRAFQFVQMIDTNLSKPVSSPALSYLARLHDNVEARHYITLFWATYLVSGVGCLVIIASGDQLLPILMGSNWVEAGNLLRLLGFWGIGKIFHTLSSSYHINENKVYRWTKYITLGIVIIYCVPILSLIWKQDVRLFTMLYSFSYCFYWIFVYFHSIYKDYEKTPGILQGTIYKFIGINVFTLLIYQFFTDWIISVLGGDFNILVLVMVEIFITILTFYLLFYIFAQEEKSMIIRILKKN